MFGLKFLICVFLVTKPVLSKNRSVCSVQKLKSIENNVSTSILYGILRASIEYPRTGECNRELIRMLDGIYNSELWAIKGFYFHFKKILIRISINCLIYFQYLSNGRIGNAKARFCFGSEFSFRFSRWMSSSRNGQYSDHIKTI